jgi:lambda repressor-like predicted transcriptional regulator
MLRYAKAQQKKPFSQTGMMRSLLFPRETNEKDWYCAELVAAILKKGGLMNQSSNPGAATPESLHSTYSTRAAATGNPTLLRDVKTLNTLKNVVFEHACPNKKHLIAKEHAPDAFGKIQMVGNLRVVATRPPALAQGATASIPITLNSLNMQKYTVTDDSHSN